jgi:uncharacterized protein
MTMKGREDRMMRLEFRALVIAAALVLPLEMSPAMAQGAAPLAERLLSVAGDGMVRAAPDMAMITLGVVSEAPAASDALKANSESMNRIVAALKDGGMESRDLQTSGFSVDPVYSQPPRNYDGSEPFKPEIVGYRVSNNLTLRIRALDRVGAILDQAVTLGANSISGPTFTVEDPKPLQDQARREAMKDALSKGALYAEAAGVKLGPIFRIDDGYASPPQPMAPGTMLRMEAAASPPPIEAGELSFEAHVSVSWQIKD